MKIKEKRMRSYIGRANILMQNKKEKEAAKAVSDGMQYYSNNVIKALSPYAAADAGMIAVVLRHLANEIESKNVGAKELAEWLEENVTKPPLTEKQIEGIGVERDLAGLPVIYTPEDMDIWNSEDETISRIRAELENMVRGVRRDEREGLVLPGGFKMELLSTGGSRQFDTNAIIDRYDTRIAMTVLADFIFLGHQQNGSWALSSDKTELFAMACGAYLDIIAETFNSQGIPNLIDINGDHFAGITDYPKLTHGDIEDADIAKVSAFVKDMVGIGVLVPDDGLEDYIRQIGNLPERTDDTRELSQTREEQQGQNEPPEPETAAGKEPKEDDEEISEEVVEAAKKRLGRV